MTTDEAIERVKVICAPPGSILIFGLPESATYQDIEHAREILRRELSDYRVLVTLQPVVVQAIIPESPPPVVNHYHYNAAYGSKTDYETLRNLAYHTPDRTMEGSK